jgi:GNAT superfamily N-acetyltransferase
MMSLLNKEQIEYIYNTFMVYDFPPDELKPLAHLLRMVEEGLCTYYALYEGKEVLSYFGLCVKDGFALVDYLAVTPKKRGQGIGSETLKFLKEAAGDNCILIECEDVGSANEEAERITRTRRINFYLRSGFALTTAKANLFGVDYVLLTFPEKSEAETKFGYETVYRAMLGDEMYNKYMKL